MTRPPIASKDPEVQRLWAEGLGKMEILRRLGMRTRGTASVFGAIDPQGPRARKRVNRYRADEMRVYQRYPIDRHKPD